MVAQDGTGTSGNTENSSYLLGEKIFTMRIVKYWKQLPREAVISSALEMSRNRLDMSLSNLI